MNTTKDVIIVGSGILGTTVARILSRYNLEVLVLEKAYDLGEGATKANSAVLSAGYHARGGSLKGISSASGNKMYEKICEELDVKAAFPGSLHVAFHEEGIEELQKKYKRGLQNGAEGLRMISREEALAMEPNLNPDIIGALYAPRTGIIDVFTLLIHTAEAAKINGVDFLFDCGVNDIVPSTDGEDFTYEVITDKGTFRSRYIVNTAGKNAALVESCVRPQDLEIKPRQGQFMVFSKEEGQKLHHVIYQQQENDEKGCLLAPSIEGNIIAGPTSINVANYNHTETTKKGLDHVMKVSRKIMPDLNPDAVITSFSGNRSNIVNVEKEEKDFVIRKSERHFISALGIKNPGITAAPYLCNLIREELVNEGLQLTEKGNYIAKPEFAHKFIDCPPEKQQQLLASDESYGRIICYCEKVTEGDLLAILREPLPPKSLNGLKKRLRIGMGECQGGFCTPRVIEILSKAWDVPPEQIVKSNKGSMLVKGRIK